MAGPRSIRFESSTDAQLVSFVTRHPGLSHSGAAAMLVDEGLRMDAHPGVLFREGPSGRRAVLAGGPDVWEVVRALKSTRAAEPGVDVDELLAVVSQNTGLSERQLHVAIEYYADYPDEVDRLVDDADRVEGDAAASIERRQALLGG